MWKTVAVVALVCAKVGPTPRLTVMAVKRDCFKPIGGRLCYAARGWWLPAFFDQWVIHTRGLFAVAALISQAVALLTNVGQNFTKRLMMGFGGTVSVCSILVDT